MRTSRFALAVLALALSVLAAQPLFASVPQEQAPTAETLSVVAELQVLAAPEAPLCTVQPLDAASNLTQPQPAQLACNCFYCFTLCGQCGVSQCLADPCDCHCRKCAIE